MLTYHASLFLVKNMGNLGCGLETAVPGFK